MLVTFSVPEGTRSEKVDFRLMQLPGLKRAHVAAAKGTARSRLQTPIQREAGHIPARSRLKAAPSLSSPPGKQVLSSAPS